MKNTITFREAGAILLAALDARLENGDLDDTQYGAALAYLTCSEESHEMEGGIDDPVNDGAEYGENGVLLDPSFDDPRCDECHRVACECPARVHAEEVYNDCLCEVCERWPEATSHANAVRLDTEPDLAARELGMVPDSENPSVLESEGGPSLQSLIDRSVADGACAECWTDPCSCYTDELKEFSSATLVEWLKAHNRRVNGDADDGRRFDAYAREDLVKNVTDWVGVPYLDELRALEAK